MSLTFLSFCLLQHTILFLSFSSRFVLNTVAFLADIFRNTTLKGVLKENHSALISDLKFCRQFSEYGNLFATVGGTQANVYRVPEAGVGVSVDLFMQFENGGPFPAPQKQLSATDLALLACAWIVPEGERDALLLVGGRDRCIHALSLGFSQEVFQLAGI